MANRSVEVTLRATASQYIAEVKKASAATRELADATEAVSKSKRGKVDDALIKNARAQQEAAQQAKQSWQETAGAMSQVGGALTAVGGATLALMGAVAKTGIEYNTLQQTSRAALSTMLGGAEAANAQMDKLDAFARTSPFSKSTFITAQQQMLAFGIESQKVIPYLDAINDAVAAAGGNSQQVGELAFIMAQISSASKITAQDLMQFGQRGVNAAELIGSQMGMTATEIREQITDGTLDAGAALDALAAGMKETYGGAAENVKNTMAGAVDRVKAAWRDLSAAMMEPLVGQNGGGVLVDLTNGLADFLRSIEGMPGPVKIAGGALTTLFGVAATGAGGFLMLAPRIVETRAAIETLSTSSPAAARGMNIMSTAAKGLGKALGAIAVASIVLEIGSAFASIGDGMAQTADEMETTVARITEGTKTLDAAFQQVDGSALTTDLFGLVDGIHDLDSALAALDMQWIWDGGRGDGSIFGIWETDATAAHEAFNRLSETLASMWDADPAGAAAAFAEQMRQLEAAGRDSGFAMQHYEEYLGKVAQQVRAAGPEYAHFADNADALADIASGKLPAGLAMTEQGIMSVSQAQADGIAYTDHLGKSYAAAADGADQLSQAQQNALDASEAQRESLNAAAQALQDYYDAAIGASNSQIKLEESIAKATEAVEKNGKGLDLATEAGRNNQSALNDLASAALRVEQDMAAAGASTSEMRSSTQRARDEFVRVAQQMGLTGAEANRLADRYGLVPDTVETRITQPGMSNAQSQVATYTRQVTGIPNVKEVTIRTVADLSGYWNVNRTLNSIAGKTVSTYVAIRQYGQGAIATGGYGQHVADAIGLAGGGMPSSTRRYSGLLEGPGTPTSDSIPAWLSRKEFVTKAAAVDYYGADAYYALNRLTIPREWLRSLLGIRLAEGGMATAPARTYASAAPNFTITLQQPQNATQAASEQRGDTNITVYESESAEVTGRVIAARLEAML